MKSTGEIFGSMSTKTMKSYVNIVKTDNMMKQKPSFRKDKEAILSKLTGRDWMIGVLYIMHAMRVMMIL